MLRTAQRGALAGLAILRREMGVMVRAEEVQVA